MNEREIKLICVSVFFCTIHTLLSLTEPSVYCVRVAVQTHVSHYEAPTLIKLTDINRSLSNSLICRTNAAARTDTARKESEVKPWKLVGDCFIKWLTLRCVNVNMRTIECAFKIYTNSAIWQNLQLAKKILTRLYLNC